MIKDLPLCSLHDFRHVLPLSFIVVIVLEFHPGVHWVSSLSMFSDVHSPVLGLGFNTEQVEIVEWVKNEETPDGRPQSDTDTAGDIDAKKIPRHSCVALKLFLNKDHLEEVCIRIFDYLMSFDD